MPATARWLGYAGLLPQLAAVAIVLTHHPSWRFAALALAYAYAALILSFIGGVWWGLAARSGGKAEVWVWIAAVMPSLIALASAIPWAIGTEWPGPSLGWLGFALLGSIAIDYKLQGAGLAPSWWMTLRIPLSLGLGVLTLLAAIV